MQCFDELQTDGNAATSRNASALLNSLKNCTTIVALAVSEYFSSLLLPLTTLLQSKSLDLVACCNEVDDLVSLLQEHRATVFSFSPIFASSVKLCSIVGASVVIPRSTSRQQHRSNILSVVPTLSDEDYFRISVYTPFLDFLLTELTDRFISHRSNAFLLQMLVPKYCLSHVSADLVQVLETYGAILPGGTSEVEQEFKLWQIKCQKGRVSADNAIEASEQCKDIFPNILYSYSVFQYSIFIFPYFS